MPSVRRPSREHVVDAIALVLLLASLALPWNLVQDGGRRAEVAASVVLAVAALALSPLRRRGRLSRWTPQEVATARCLAALPYAACALVSLLVDAARGLHDDAGHAGLGGSLALGLAGAVLAARYRRPLAVLAVLAGLLALGAVVATAVSTAKVWGFGSATADARPLLAGLAVLVLALPALAGLSVGGAGWRVVAVVVGAASAVAYVVGAWAWPATLAPVESVHGAGFGLVLLAPAGAAAALVPPHPVPAGDDGGDARRWTTAAAAAALVAAALGVVLTAGRLDGLAAGQRDAHDIALGLAAAVGTVLALVVRSALRRSLAGEVPDPLAGVVPVAVAAVVVGVLDLLLVAGDVSAVLTQPDVLGALVLPVVVLALLVGPASSRRAVAAARRSPWAQAEGPAQAAPAGVSFLPGGTRTAPEASAEDDWGASEGSSPAGPPSSDGSLPSDGPLPPRGRAPGPELTPGQAADPATSPALLAAIVEVAPHLRPAVAANPAASEELLARLRGFADPDVDAVLRARGLS